MSVHRIEVRPRQGLPDPQGAALARQCQAAGLAKPPSRIDVASVYLIEGSLDDTAVRRIADELLTDPVTQQATLGAGPPVATALVEVHPLPGVMDPDADAVRIAIHAMLGANVGVRTGRRFDLYDVSPDAARDLADRCLANTVIHDIHQEPYWPDAFPRGHARALRVVTVPLSELDDEGLLKLSRQAHLFLDLDEMRAIQFEYRRLGREPREIELETLAQTWSEHCVHKTLKSRIRYEGNLPVAPGKVERPGQRCEDDGAIVIENLLAATVAAATHELIAEGIDWCLSVFVDNAGVIAFDQEHAVCFKCETHNHPSAIEPYGGAATGVGGCIRDIMGTGLAARPIANTDVFCVAHPDHWEHATLPAGCLHPKRILTQVVAGVRDYGNRMGIPTLNGAVYFDDDYVGNPLVFCGCVGVMPRDLVEGEPCAGDHIVAVGGRTGRDGIHGATFSSAELTDTHADEFSHAVQIGNAVTEKKTLDAILEARDHPDGCLFTAITDCGAGGFSSAVGEMGESLGAEVHLERAPLKYDGLSPTEIWISEAQERMVLAIPPERLTVFKSVCDTHDVEMCDLGIFGTTDRSLRLNFQGTEVGRLDMTFLHEGLPRRQRKAKWNAPAAKVVKGLDDRPLEDQLLATLADPNIASKHWIIRQYDHEVQGASVVKPLVGRRGQGPSDAAVILPVHGSRRGLAIANGLATYLRDDPYQMALAAIDECVRNLVCVGADPERIAILDNFCWPGCDDPEVLGGLVRAAVGCYDGAKAYRTPFISGKDSLNNQYTTEDGRTIRIPPTLLISGMGIVPDVDRAITMDAKSAGNALVLVGPTNAQPLDLAQGPGVAKAVHRLMQSGIVASAHDCSDGGILVAAAEMCIGGELGLELSAVEDGFAQTSSRYLLEVTGDPSALGDVPWSIIGTFNDTGRLTIQNGALDVTVEALSAAWRGTLDW
jgi:phosphoribosylformylglycinamidine synthase